ncbi:MAG TPA: metal ABC transporter permease, partial [Cytophagaceae bacterium]
MNEFYIILTGCLVAISCSLLGCFLILRKMSLVGDAISHAVLPGIVIAFLFSGSRDTLPMLVGAGSLGLITTFLIEFFHRKAQLQEDAS